MTVEKVDRLKILSNKESKKVMVVAHPDDESLFGAGLIIRYPGDWTIICCSIPLRDSVRADKFLGACRVLNSHPAVVQVIEPGAKILFSHSHLYQIPCLDKFDLIVTHNKEGEYGHIHHKQIHEFVKKRYDEKSIYFGYKLSGKGEMLVTLSANEWDKKLEAINCYSHELPYKGRIMPKSQALLEEYGSKFDLKNESYIME